MDIDVSDEPDSCVAAAESAKSIKAIDKTTVHRICSGQVVLTLATAVKELVENSIDAGATSVEVRLRDHGTSLLEVCDNGKGVEEENFEGLTLKHHTSKIRDFGDLVGVKTFGFRGEALSSLCALSNLTVVTRHTSLAVGTKLVYNHNGILTSKTPLSRQVGTTVSLQNLFSTLPVRHKEFQRNIKKEFTKMVQILYSYCLISTGVRIICTNQTDKGKKTVVVSTDGHGSVKENISSVFGAKQVSSILEFQQEMASTDVLTEYGMPTLEISQDNYLFTIEGFISSCAHGQGRSATDRQFYFINSRPCDPAKVMKLVNEVYHYYNRHQSPFVVLNIHLKEGDVDINVTPDKRQILVNNEKIMLATIKTSMIKLYENIPSTYHMQNTSLNSPMNRSFDSSQGSRSPSVASPSTNSSGGRVSALTLKFGRKFGGSPASESSESPLSSPLAVGLKRSLSQNTANSSPSNKQPKLETFFKNKSLPLSSSNGSTDSPDSTQPSLNGDALDFVSQSNSEIERFDNSLDSVLENIEVDDNGVVSMISAEDKENLPGEWKENGTATDPGVKGCRELDNLSEEKSGLPPSSAVDEVMPSSGNVTVGRGDQVDVECAEERSIVNNESNISSSVNGKPSQSESILSKFSFVLDSEMEKNSSAGNNGRSGGSEGKGEVKSVLSRFSRPVTSPSASCKKVHSATNDFLSNLMARKSDKKKSVVENRTMEQMKVDEILVLDGEDDTKVPVDEGDFDMASESESSPQKNNKSKLVICEEYNPEDYIAKRKSKCINFNLESLKKKIAASEKRKENRSLMRKFHAKIAPGDNKSAEDELRKEISKDMFAKMEILGQFNLGFIIAKLGSDLFIVDQHATDEKYNFETLQQTCVLQNQRLIIPQLLELTAVNESILLDNIEIFKKNGFEFKVDEEKRVGRRVNLTSMPFSRGWEFGREDIEELIFMLSDSPGVMCRPSRVRAMFASRSCRKSIMIGTALTKSQMQKLVVHMGEIEQPWNCPHGRPTMRHLVNLDMISSASETE